jgi:hypothetical protein
MFKYPCGFFESTFNIAIGPLAVRLHVGQLDFPFGRIFVPGRVIVQDRRPRLDRLRIGFLNGLFYGRSYSAGPAEMSIPVWG